MHIPETMEICLCDGLKYRQGNGELLGIVFACGLLGSKSSSESGEREGLRAGVLSALPKGGTLLIKTYFHQH